MLFGLEAPEELKEGSCHASRRSRRGSDVFILREEWAYPKGIGAACVKDA